MRIAITLPLFGLGVIGCVSSGDGDISVDNSLVCRPVNDQSMIETSSAIVTETRFNLKRVFDQIRTTTPAGVSVPPSATAMFQEIYKSFADCTSDSTLDPNHYGLSCRASEASFGTLDPFNGGSLHYKPVALVNRFDLAPKDLSTCGESRIVFWKESGPPGRASIIVEMRTPPVVVNGASSCVPVANFWANLSGISDPAKRASLLEHFFFKGLPGMAFPPVSAMGVGFGGRGQVRLNSFVNFAQWNLREFKWQAVCPKATPCSAHFVTQDVKNNPSQLLFSGKHVKAPAFQSWFVSTATPALAGATDVNALALGNATEYDTYESVSQPFPSDPTSVLYDQNASATLRTNVQAELTRLGSPLSPTDIFARATTQTCGGCHQVSNNANLGGMLVWPTSLGFVQIDENANLSVALSGTFIPHRIQVLESFLCGGPPPGAPDNAAN
jgi:hypothetical protein